MGEQTSNAATGAQNPDNIRWTTFNINWCSDLNITQHQMGSFLPRCGGQACGAGLCGTQLSLHSCLQRPQQGTQQAQRSCCARQQPAWAAVQDQTIGRGQGRACKLLAAAGWCRGSCSRCSGSSPAAVQAAASRAQQALKGQWVRGGTRCTARHYCCG